MQVGLASLSSTPDTESVDSMSTETLASFDPDFDHVFTVHEDGTVTDTPELYAPDVYHSETDDVEILGTGWTALTGWTGQYSYSGACMHASEYFGGGVRTYVLTTPGTYALVVVEVMPEEDEEYPPEPAGWAILRKL